MKLKKINELFDDEFQRDTAGDSEFIFGRKETGNPILKFLHKIWYEVPVLGKCVDDPDEYHFIHSELDVMTFIIRNEEWHLSVTLFFKSFNQVDMCILWQAADYDGDVFVPLENPVLDFCHIGDFESKSADEVCLLLKKHFIPLLKRFDFPSWYYNKETQLSRLN